MDSDRKPARIDLSQPEWTFPGDGVSNFDACEETTFNLFKGHKSDTDRRWHKISLFFTKTSVFIKKTSSLCHSTSLCQSGECIRSLTRQRV